MLHDLPTVIIPQWAIRKIGAWENTKRRFGLTDQNQFVVVFSGTRLYRDGEESPNQKPETKTPQHEE